MGKKVVRVYITISFWFEFWVAMIFPTFAIFLKSNDIDYAQMGLLQAVYAGCALLFEVPTGILADIWGRKQSILFGIFAWMVGCLIYWMSETFVYFMLAEVMVALGAACLSGIVSSWVKSMLRYHEVAHCSTDILARGMLMHKLGLILGGAAGGIVAVFDIVYIWGFVIFGLGTLAIYVHVYMHEDYAKAPRSGTASFFSEIQLTLRIGLTFMRSNVRVRNVVVIGALTAGSFSAVNIQWAIMAEEFWGTWSISPLWILIQTLGFMGVLLIRWLLNATEETDGFFAQLSRWRFAQWLLAKQFSRTKLLYLGNGATALCIVLAVITPYGWMFLTFFALHELPRVFYEPILKGIVHDAIPDEADMQRATIMSMYQMALSLSYTVTAIVTGAIAKIYGARWAWIVAALVLCSSLVVLYKSRK